MTKAALKGCSGLVPVLAPSLCGDCTARWGGASSGCSQTPALMPSPCCPPLSCSQGSQSAASNPPQANFTRRLQSVPPTSSCCYPTLTTDWIVISGLVCPLVFGPPKTSASPGIPGSYWSLWEMSSQPEGPRQHWKAITHGTVKRDRRGQGNMSNSRIRSCILVEE